MLTRWLTISAALVAAAAPAAVALPPPVPNIQRAPAADGRERPVTQGRLRFESTRFEFGQIVEDLKPTGHFVFTNTGTEDLFVYEVKPTCGCTLADLRRVTGPIETTPGDAGIAGGGIDLTNTVVIPPLADGPARFAPGESGVIAITFDSHAKRGPQNRQTRVFSSDGSGTLKTLSMVGHVDPLVIVDPPVINFGNLDKGEVKTEEIWVYGRTPDFEVPRVSTSDDTFSVEVLETEAREYRGEMLRATRLRVTSKPDTKVGTDTATLYIRTNDERRSMVTTTARGSVRGDLQVIPGLVRLGTLQAGQPFERQVRVVNRRGVPFRILGGALTHPSVNASVTAEPVDAANPTEYVLTIRGRGLRAVPRLQGEITIRTDLAGEETLRLRYSAAIRPPQQATPQPATPNN
ncbi:MAG: DUF1573 domain-containing protein [Planctomycetota bacterium]